MIRVINPASSVIRRMLVEDDQHPTCSPAYQAAFQHVALIKRGAAAPETTNALVGTLYLSRSGWILLNVPNALGRGAFDALNEPGVELPLNDAGQFQCHISVIRPEELEKIGGPDKISERGHQFHYTLGPVKTVQPDGWDGVSRVWFIEIKSPELMALRRSYGLSSLPNEGKFQFHVTFAVRKSKVLQTNATSKAGT